MPVVRGKVIEPLFTAEQIAERNRAMAADIAAGPTKDLLVIAILKGSFIFAADLLRALHDTGLAPEVEFITLSSYGTGTVSQGVRIVKDIDSDVKDRDVLLIDDILESGRTLKFAKEILYERGARHVSVAVLLDKHVKRKEQLRLCRVRMPGLLRRRLRHGRGLCVSRTPLRRRRDRRRLTGGVKVLTMPA
jgi:hypoxanthine phosphoribosyltransferase